jgi:hypothetical protein
VLYRFLYIDGAIGAVDVRNIDDDLGLSFKLLFFFHQTTLSRTHGVNRIAIKEKWIK